MLLVANSRFLLKLIFLDYEKTKIDIKLKDSKLLNLAEKFLYDYFERKIWYPFKYIDYSSLNVVQKRLMKIPFGKFLYYNNFNIFPRLVGKMLSLNKLPIFIPCHRVISRRGIGGYTPHVKIKEYLLKHEGIISF
ncbi:MAG: MGMT family protein [candidate division WOR-3 bacterium]|nr:MGMT family protein [candidate division WOR-3 bacterium]MCX7948309.1 MGMT family protein [candidate division WOR-3 bacterium]MDW8151145.1 MGMT family protein [candidate division WOR-3 bacterium]